MPESDALAELRAARADYCLAEKLVFLGSPSANALRLEYYNNWLAACRAFRTQIPPVYKLEVPNGPDKY